MVSSHAIHSGNRKTLDELLVVRPEEKRDGPVAIQLFGQDPAIMRGAAARAAEAGADVIDLNMGCPVPKVCKTGAGAALLKDHDTAVAVARAAHEGSGLPVTVKLRAGQKPGERDGVVLARRLVEEGGVASLCFHPRSAAVRHKGTPDYPLVAEIVAGLDVPIVVSGGMTEAAHVRRIFAETGAAAVMLARGALGNPWLFSQVLGDRDDEPTRDEVLDELEWLVDRCEEHVGPERAARWLRKAYPWYVARLGEAHAVQDAFQRAESLDEQRDIARRLRTLQPA
jgi:nifR3 family TIM-barrel protein